MKSSNIASIRHTIIIIIYDNKKLDQYIVITNTIIEPITYKIYKCLQ